MNKPKKSDTGDEVPKNSKSDKRKKTKNKAQEAAMEAAMQMRGESHSLGSYTGTAQDGDAPEQDADDL